MVFYLSSQGALLAHVEVVTQTDGLNQSDCDNHYKS